MTRNWLDLPLGTAQGLPPARRRALLDQLMADRVATLAQARAAAFPPGTPQLPTVQPPPSP